MARDLRIIQTSLPGAQAEFNSTGGIADRMGIQVVEDFYFYAAKVGAAYQVRAGTITTPLVGDVVLTDTAAEMSLDAVSGTTVIPVNLNISMRLLTGTLHEYAAKSVGAVSSAGTAFVPLPLKMGGAACVATARVSANGGVTVTAELATTTRRHWSYSNPAAGATGALPTAGYSLDWSPRMPPILQGAACFYVQIAATGTGPSYYAAFDFLEIPTATLL